VRGVKSTDKEEFVKRNRMWDEFTLQSLRYVDPERRIARKCVKLAIALCYLELKVTRKPTMNHIRAREIHKKKNRKNFGKSNFPRFLFARLHFLSHNQDDRQFFFGFNF